MIADVDFETRSTTDLLKAGVYRYAEDPNTEAWCMSWAIGEEDPLLWWEGQPFPERLAAHIAAGGELRAWNAAFERTIWRLIMTPRHGWPEPAMEQWFCTAAEAAAMSLPRKLEQAAVVCKLPQQKDAEGHKLMRKMSAPRKLTKKEKATLPEGTIIWHEMTADNMMVIGEYCRQDVRTERGMYRATRRLGPLEREVYLMNERMNDRGIYLDVPLVHAARRIAKQAVDEATEGLIALTGGDVGGPTKLDDLKDWIQLQGIAAPSLAKKSVALILEKELPEDVREAIRLRQEGGKASTAKLDTMLKVVTADSRMHGLSLYHGAGTGRFSGRLVQPHNLPRGEVGKYVENYIPDVMSGAYAVIDLLAPPLVVVSSLMRSMLTAAPGHDLLVSDYAAIECRGVNWLAGQDDVIDSFRSFDAAPKADKPNFDPYRKMAVKMGRGATPKDVNDKGRQAGKAAELGCGFQMGGKKFVTAAWDVYQVKLTLDEAKAAVKIYRESHPKVVQFWKDANDAALGAVNAPGSVQRIGPRGSIKVTYQGAYLYIILPCGRPLVYAAPSIVERLVETDEGHSFKSAAVQFYGMHPKYRQWMPMYLYGGLITENIVQAIARDIMVDGGLGVYKKGYVPILFVHDEVVSEVQKEHGSLEEYESILRTAPAWAEGFPVMTEGWRGTRYRK